jgi:hypothetical protein
MTETLRPESRFSTEFEGIGTDLQVVSPDDSNQPIQLVWEQPAEDATVDMVGSYTELVKMPPRRIHPDVSWSGINRRNLAQDTCRRTTNFISGSRVI